MTPQKKKTRTTPHSDISDFAGCHSNDNSGATQQVRTLGRLGDRSAESGDLKHAHGHVAQVVLAEHLDAESLSVRGGHDGHELLERMVARQALAVCTCSIDGCARLRAQQRVDLICRCTSAQDACVGDGWAVTLERRARDVIVTVESAPGPACCQQTQSVAAKTAQSRTRRTGLACHTHHPWLQQAQAQLAPPRPR